VTCNSTALTAFIRSINKPGVKIITIEDPIEYHLDGIVQTQVDKKNYTFASGLREILRQDPDVIMVGEIRDGDVAETAIHASF
jgi:type II secretory ATPase GspE/PulE/Tfp pilus assembly ATPase PilB-like protein